MAMLAEPKRKVKYSINPNGLDWSKDSSKFGQKLMEKMGWQQGKGLGANEDGHVAHIAVRAKQDNRGVGCTIKHADNWIAHQDDFNSLLANLNQDHGSKTPSLDGDGVATQKVHSLEAKSKNSRARVHYHKFARGKDLSMRKEEELNSIFGKRKSASEPITPQVQSEANSDNEAYSDNDDNSHLHGIMTTTSSSSIQEYFALKMAQLKAARVKESGSSSGQDDKSTSEDTTGTKKKKNVKVEENGEVEENPIVDKCENDGIVPVGSDVCDGFSRVVHELDGEVVKGKSKRKKKSKTKESALPGCSTLPSERSVIGEEHLSGEETIRKKSRKRKGVLDAVDKDPSALKKQKMTEGNGDTGPEAMTVVEDKGEKKRKRKKKMDKKLDEEESGLSACKKQKTIDENVVVASDNIEKTMSQKRNKNGKKKRSQVDSELEDSGKCECDDKKAADKKSKECGEDEADTVMDQEDNPVGRKRSKSKRKKLTSDQCGQKKAFTKPEVKDAQKFKVDTKLPKRANEKTDKLNNLAANVHFPGSNIHEITGYGISKS